MAVFAGPVLLSVLFDRLLGLVFLIFFLPDLDRVLRPQTTGTVFTLVLVAVIAQLL